MYIEKRLAKSFLEMSIWSSWPDMLVGLEFRPRIYPNYSITFGVTVFYRVLFFIEYTRFRGNT